MTTLAISPFASWLIVGGLWIIIGFGVSVCFGRIAARGEKVERAHRAEIDGPLSALAEHSRRRQLSAHAAAERSKARRAEAYRKPAA